MGKKSKKKLGGGKGGSAASSKGALVDSKVYADDSGYDSFGDEDTEIDFDTFEMPPREDCPLCMDPLPVDPGKTAHMTCCGKILCHGCSRDHQKSAVERGISRDIRNQCVYCRTPAVTSGDAMIRQTEASAARGDGDSYYQLAIIHQHGGHGLPINHQKSFELFHKAIAAGCPFAANQLGVYYMRGGHIVKKDEEKGKRLLCKAAKGGCVASLHTLGQLKLDWKIDKCLCYFSAAAKAGYEPSMDIVKGFYQMLSNKKHALALAILDSGLSPDSPELSSVEPFVFSKDNYMAVLRAHLEVLREEHSDSRMKAKGNTKLNGTLGLGLGDLPESVCLLGSKS